MKNLGHDRARDLFIHRYVPLCNVSIQIVAYEDNSINPTSFLGWMDTFEILIRELINDVETLEWDKYLIMWLIK